MAGLAPLWPREAAVRAKARAVAAAVTPPFRPRGPHEAAAGALEARAAWGAETAAATREASRATRGAETSVSAPLARAAAAAARASVRAARREHVCRMGGASTPVPGGAPLDSGAILMAAASLPRPRGRGRRWTTARTFGARATRGAAASVSAQLATASAAAARADARARARRRKRVREIVEVGALMAISSGALLGPGPSGSGSVAAKTAGRPSPRNSPGCAATV